MRLHLLKQTERNSRTPEELDTIRALSLLPRTGRWNLKLLKRKKKKSLLILFYIFLFSSEEFKSFRAVKSENTSQLISVEAYIVAACIIIDTGNRERKLSC
jgi:hypothetical protein